MLIGLFRSWRARQRVRAQKMRSSKSARPQVEGLETREVPTVSVLNGIDPLLGLGTPTQPAFLSGAGRSMSADGRYIVYESASSSIAAGLIAPPTGTGVNLAIGGTNLFLFDRLNESLKLITHDAGNISQLGNGASNASMITPDGRYIVYLSNSSNLVVGTDQVFQSPPVTIPVTPPSDSQSTFDVFVYDVVADTNTLVSHRVGLPTTAANNRALNPVISDDGNFIAFHSLATTMTTGVDTNGSYDVFLWDRATNTVRLVTHTFASPSTAGNQTIFNFGADYSPAISADGAWVAFTSRATNHVSGSDTNNQEDIFLYETATGQITLVSHADGLLATAGDDRSSAPSISSDGRYLAYHTYATTLVPGNDVNGFNLDVYVYDRLTRNNTLVTHIPDEPNTFTSGGGAVPRISKDGRFVTYSSTSPTLVVGSDTNVSRDVFVYDRENDTNQLVSHAFGNSTIAATGDSTGGVISADGSYIAYVSTATDLSAGVYDDNSTFDIFLWERATNTSTLASHRQTNIFLAGDLTSGSPSFALSLSGQAGLVAPSVTFPSVASNLILNDTNGNTQDVFVYNALPSVSLQGDQRVTEGNSGVTTVTVAVTLSSLSVQPVTVEITAEPGTALAGSDFDFVPATQTLSFAPGQTSLTVSVDVKGDTFREANETILFHLTNPDNALPGTNVSQVTILNDEHAAGVYRNNFFMLQAADTTLSYGIAGDTPLSGDWDGNGISDIGIWRSARFYLDSDASQSYTLADVVHTFGNATDTPIVGDWDGDGSSNIGVWRAGRFYFDMNNDGLFTGADVSFSFGSVTDVPIVGDWNSDGVDDIGVWRPSTAMFYLDSDGSLAYNIGDASFSYGSSTDRPLVGDWDADGASEIGVWRNGNIYLDTNSSQAYEPTDRFAIFGSATDLPLVGDWNGDRFADLALFNAGTFTLDTDGNFAIGTTNFAYRASIDTPLTGDWNGDGKDDAGTFRNGSFFLDTNQSRVFDAGDANFGFSAATDLPIVGDWNGDGRDEIGVFRNGVFYLDSNGSRSFDAADAVFTFGTTGDRPIAGDWNGDGISEVGVFRNGTFFLDTNGNRAFDGADATFSFGAVGDTPLAGDWNGDGRDEIAVWRAGTFYFDTNGSRAFDIADLVFAFGLASDRPIVGRW